MARGYSAEDGVEPISDSFAEIVGSGNAYNVMYGCGLTYDSGDMTVDLAAGVITHNLSHVAVAAASNAFTIVSDPTHPRWTWLALSSAGAAEVVSGDPAAAPSVPELGDRVPLALLLVQAGQTIASDITYKLGQAVQGQLGWNFIDLQSVSSASTTIADFTSLPNVYKAFRITIGHEQITNSATVNLRFNNDSGNNYEMQSLTANGDGTGGTNVSNEQTTGASSIVLTNNSAAAASTFAGYDVKIIRNSSSSPAVVLTTAGNQAAANTPKVTINHGVWNNTTDAISRITVFTSAANADVGSYAILEGLIAN